MDKNADHIQSPEKDLISDYTEKLQTDAFTTYDIDTLLEDIDVATEDIIASAWGPLSKEDYHASEIGPEQRDKLYAEEKKLQDKRDKEKLIEEARGKRVNLSKIKKGKSKAKKPALTPSTPPPNQLALVDHNATPRASTSTHKASTSCKSHLITWAR